MRREDVNPLLVQAVDGMFEPDLADAAWTAAVGIRRRRRRSRVIALVAILVIGAVIALIATLGGGKAGIAPPTTPPPGPPGAVQPAGQISGMDFWVAPPSGSERYLDHLDTPMGEALKLPDSPANLGDSPVKQIAAVVLASHSGSYDPLLLGNDGKWSRADVRLSAIGTGAPLSSGAVSPNGALVAFPQPGQVLVLSALNAKVRQIDVPTQDLRSVSWLPDGNRLLVSGPDAAYRVVIGSGGYGERDVTPVEPSSDPDAATAPYRLDDAAGRVALSQYSVDGGWAPSAAVQLPVASWVGQTFGGGPTAARLFIADELPQITKADAPPQVVAAISGQRSLPDRLLVLGPSPPPTAGTLAPDVARAPGCCLVLGWYDDNTVLIQVQSWVIAWGVRSGHVRRVTELEVSGVALGPGVRG
ncbi:hypothetical protein F1D05_06275 [Kribbella qitaiheensis]|uniref:WD40 repeat domain-containing protein n=1 Tax=Kribbella qitaiheensis TaxID=1544730 RepID=A0A7G6WUC0_9ACTN|nr:hypothetical protein [Kribbella qitaiheensis]QNE17585.1 hypothetical protein F1D05_06275 [Kribbella qitaiheensis]